jgi:FMN phosphatase YigB (HAD superfamily)
MSPELFLFDLDSTLAVKWEPELLGGRAAELERLPRPAAIVTNQGGVHARYAWEARDEPERAAKYPSLETIMARITAITRQLPMIQRAYAALHVGHNKYPLPENREDIIETLASGALFHASWQRSWRKPKPGMLRQACLDFGVTPAQALMVGDREDDEVAAAALGMPFIQVGEEVWQPGFLAGHFPKTSA